MQPPSDTTTERVYFDPPRAQQPVETWWARYSGTLTGLTLTARAALEADSRYVLRRGIFGDGEPGSDSWPSGRVRTGLVMGSVQSGKTASMLGVSALALDHGVDIVIVMAGTRISLWRQTYERLAAQLDSGPEGASKVAGRLLSPPPGVALSDSASRLTTTYQMAPAVVRRRLGQKKPIIVVAMKQTHHLHALAGILRDNVFGTVRDLDRPVHMLVLDDEADDGSILDAVVESGQDPVFGNLKQIPRAIANLWDPAEAAPDNLFTTYIGYTATPQANLLQEDHNPLSPRDFVISLRTPLDIGHPVDVANPGDLSAPRSSTYPEPVGSHAYYTGGEVFYRRGQAAALCATTTGNANHDLAEAVRAFLVAGAIRLHRSGRAGPLTASSMTFASEQEALDAVAQPHSMLFHPSAAITDHFTGAEDVLIWAGLPDRAAARALLETGDARLPDSLVATLDTDSASWAVWLDRYRDSAKAIATEFNLLNPPSIPDWPTVKALLADEVIPGTRVSVVNSDPTADDRPLYRPTLDESTHQWSPARDLSTIFVSGNVMARGLTLEGMTTALFQRSSTNPFADTQMQMQRWFGYRGPYVELCRVFADTVQLDLFRAYHDIDEAIRVAITEHMSGAAPEPAILQGMNFLATGKIANTGQRPLSPGSRPFIKLMNDGADPDPNVEVVARQFRGSASSDLTVGGTLRGRIRDTPLTLIEAAELLESFVYDQYQPGRDHQLAEHWSQVESRVAAVQPLASPGLYRAPLLAGPASDVRVKCPYSISAYLRLWDACLTRPVRGLFVTGQPADLWSMSDLLQKQAHQPRFWVGIRYGGGGPITTDPLAGLPFDVLATTKNIEGGEVKNAWGTNDPTAGPGQYRGDEFFDYYHRGEPVPRQASDSGWRPTGSDGQILFYVNQRPGQPHPTVAVGVCIPAGGPEQFSATRAGVLTT